MANNIPKGFIQENEVVSPLNIPKGFIQKDIPVLDDEEKSMLPEFLQQLGEDWVERTRLVEESKKAYEEGKIGFGEYTTQVAGKGVAGRVLDVAGATISGAIDGVSFLLPVTTELVANTVKTGWDMVLNTEAGKSATEALNEGIESYEKWKEVNPQDAKTFESVVNIALVFAPVKGRGKSSPVPSFEKTANKIVESGRKSQHIKSIDNIQEMLYPNITSEMAKRTTEKGVFRRATYLPTGRDIAIFNDVSKVPKLKTSRSPFYNLDKIQKEIGAEGRRLEALLQSSKIIFPRTETIKNLTNKVEELLKTNTFIAGDKQISRTIQLNLEKAVEIINRHPSTPLGLLKARREFDSVLREQMPKVFDAKAQTIATESSKVFRNAMNSMINEKVPSAFVNKSLMKQSNLFSARDMLSPIAAKATRTSIGRLFQNVSKVIGPKMEINRAVAILGAGSAFQAASLTPILAGYAGSLAVGGTTYGIIRLLGNPKTRIALGKLLGFTNQAIQKSTNPKMIKQLRIDRAFLQDLLEISTDEIKMNMEKFK
jgi:hypothetical protein